MTIYCLLASRYPRESYLRHFVATLVYPDLPTEFSPSQVWLSRYTIVYPKLFSGHMEPPRSYIGSSSGHLKYSRGTLDLVEATLRRTFLAILRPLSALQGPLLDATLSPPETILGSPKAT